VPSQHIAAGGAPGMGKGELPDGIELVDPRLEGARDTAEASPAPSHVKLPSMQRTSHGPGGVAEQGGVCVRLWPVRARACRGGRRRLMLRGACLTRTS